MASTRKNLSVSWLCRSVLLPRRARLVALLGMAALAWHCGSPNLELEIPENIDWLVVIDTDSEDGDLANVPITGRSGFMRRSDFSVNVSNLVGHTYVYGFREKRLRRYFARQEDFDALPTLLPRLAAPCVVSLPTEWVADVTSSTVSIQDPKEMPNLIVPGLVEACPVLAGPIEPPPPEQAGHFQNPISQVGCLVTYFGAGATDRQLEFRINDLGEACVVRDLYSESSLIGTCRAEPREAADEYEISCQDDRSFTIDAIPEHRLRCKDGDCQFACKPGTAQCDGANGPCGYNVLDDTNHCGACGIVCPEGVPCIAGACGGEVQFDARSRCALFPAGFARCFGYGWCEYACRLGCGSECRGCCDDRVDIAITYGMTVFSDRDPDEPVPTRFLSGLGTEREPMCLVTSDGQVLCTRSFIEPGQELQDRFAPFPGFGIADKVAVSRWFRGDRYYDGGSSRICAVDGEGILRCAQKLPTFWTEPEEVVLPGPVVDVAISGLDICAVLQDGGVWCSDRSEQETAVLAPARKIFRGLDVICVITASGTARCSTGSGAPPNESSFSDVRNIVLAAYRDYPEQMFLVVGGVHALEPTRVIAFYRWGWGDFSAAFEAQNLEGVVALGVSNEGFVCGIRPDGTRVCL